MLAALRPFLPLSCRLALSTLPLLLVLSSSASTAQPMCVYGVSKNICNGRLDATWTSAACSVNPTNTACNTASAHQAQFNAPLAPGGPTCDEVPELDGDTLSASFEGNLRLQAPDQYRGSLIGRFSVLQGGQSLAAGTFDATLGVGTHRPLNCLCTSGTCEECWAVSFDPTAQVWLIHSEGFLEGSFSGKVRPGCTIHWSYAGTFSARAADQFPQLSGPWAFCGAIDGVIECPCPQTAVKHRRPGA